MHTYSVHPELEEGWFMQARFWVSKQFKTVLYWTVQVRKAFPKFLAAGNKPGWICAFQE